MEMIVHRLDACHLADKDMVFAMDLIVSLCLLEFGFALDDKRMRRAGLDYHEFANIVHYDSESEFVSANRIYVDK